MKDTVSIAKTGAESLCSGHFPTYPGKKVMDSGLHGITVEPLHSFMGSLSVVTYVSGKLCKMFIYNFSTHGTVKQNTYPCKT